MHLFSLDTLTDKWIRIDSTKEERMRKLLIETKFTSNVADPTPPLAMANAGVWLADSRPQDYKKIGRICEPERISVVGHLSAYPRTRGKGQSARPIPVFSRSR
jgi:hypothetical protein